MLGVRVRVIAMVSDWGICRVRGRAIVGVRVRLVLGLGLGFG